MYNLYINNIRIELKNQIRVYPKSEGTCTDALAADASVASLHFVPPPQQPPLKLRLTCCIYVAPGTCNHFVFQTEQLAKLLLQTGIRRTCGNIENMLLIIQISVRDLKFEFDICRFQDWQYVCVSNGVVTICHEDGNYDQMLLFR